MDFSKELPTLLTKILRNGTYSKFLVLHFWSKGFTLGPTLFLLCIFLQHFSYYSYFPDVICNIAIYTDDTTLYTKFDQVLICGNN